MGERQGRRLNHGEARTTKDEIVHLLKVKGEHTVAELADVLEITEMAIRRHLSNLEKDGLIYSKMVRQMSEDQLICMD